MWWLGTEKRLLACVVAGEAVLILLCIRVRTDLFEKANAKPPAVHR
jgi:hypothetical protein